MNTARTGRTPRRAGALALVGAGVAMLAGLLAGPLAVHAAGAETPGLSGYTLAAEASGVSATFGDPTSQPYPTVAGTVPQTIASLNSGAGYALSSVAWPGPLVGNAGALAGLVLPLCDPSGQTRPQACTPPPPSGVTPLLNSPLRAEAASGAKSEDHLGPMNAYAKDTETSADTKLNDVSASSPGAFAVKGTVSRSHAVLEGSVARAESEVTLTDITLGGPDPSQQIRIRRVHSEARATSDGEKGTSGGTTVVEGLTIAGHAATIDERGIRFDGQGGPNPLGAVVAPVNDQILANMGMKLYMTTPLEQGNDKGTGRYRSGSVVFVWTIPGSGTNAKKDNPQTLIVSLGGASAVASAQKGIGFELPPLPDFTSTVVPAGGPTETFETSVLGSDTAASDAGVLPASNAAVTVPRPRARGVPVVAPDLATASVFHGVAPGAAVMAVLGAILLGLGLLRLRHVVLEPATTGGCDLERRKP